MSRPLVTVIGAGITGMTTAYELVSRGYEVEVVDVLDYFAQRCSFANGGQVSVSNSETWTTWDNVVRGLRWMFQKDAPLYVGSHVEWDKTKWLSKFLWNTFKGRHVQDTVKTIRLGLRSQIRYEDVIDREGIKFDRSYCGILHFYRDDKYLDAAKAVRDTYEQNGAEWTVVSRDRVFEIEPNLSKDSTIKGGVFTSTDWTGDVFKYCREMERILKTKYGVTFRYGFSYPIDEADHPVVVCAGVGSPRLARRVGDDLDIYPVKGYSVTVEGNGPSELPWVSLLDDQAKVVTSTLGNRLRVAGTAELAGECYDITRSRIEPLLSWTGQNLPKVDRSLYSQWACLRPMTPDMLPIVRRSRRNKNVYYNTGHGHLGWTLAAATAMDVVDIIDGDTTDD